MQFKTRLDELAVGAGSRQCETLRRFRVASGPERTRRKRRRKRGRRERIKATEWLRADSQKEDEPTSGEGSNLSLSRGTVPFHQDKTDDPPEHQISIEKQKNISFQSSSTSQNHLKTICRGDDRDDLLCFEKKAFVELSVDTTGQRTGRPLIFAFFSLLFSQGTSCCRTAPVHSRLEPATAPTPRNILGAEHGQEGSSGGTRCQPTAIISNDSLARARSSGDSYSPPY
ncbi:hypothetical protein K0M31_011824 [Melipona bicolor]|uniref:Uncharacterized protein n=1 Tax=Melipona bicolor TaxID=60889 RepID=A0AA40GAB6_9HYME|nr:hypothetical protein K0M31_011824 [Melipona bicolor]